jgi:hypothetical protein
VVRSGRPAGGIDAAVAPPAPQLIPVPGGGVLIDTPRIRSLGLVVSGGTTATRSKTTRSTLPHQNGVRQTLGSMLLIPSNQVRPQIGNNDLPLPAEI